MMTCFHFSLSFPFFPFVLHGLLFQSQFNHDDKLCWMFYLTVSYACTNLTMMDIDELLQQG
jgi:hypothetical protein